MDFHWETLHCTPTAHGAVHSPLCSRAFLTTEVHGPACWHLLGYPTLLTISPSSRVSKCCAQHPSIHKGFRNSITWNTPQCPIPQPRHRGHGPAVRHCWQPHTSTPCQLFTPYTGGPWTSSMLSPSSLSLEWISGLTERIIFPSNQNPGPMSSRVIS